jgi:hypothetical protein
VTAQVLAETPLFFSAFLVVFGARDNIGAGKPAVQVDVAAAPGAERADRFLRRLAADRAGPRLPRAGTTFTLRRPRR